MNPETFAGRTAAFAVAVSLGAPIALSRLLLQGELGANAPFILAWPAMLLAAFIGGFWPTLVMTAIGVWVAQIVLADAGARAMGPGAIVVAFAFGVIFAVAGEARIRGVVRGRRSGRRIAELQARMTSVGRLNAVGEMAGSLAHELNQPLTAIANYLSAAQVLLSQAPGAPPRAAELLQKAADQADRAAQIVARVRGSVDRGETTLVEQSLADLVREAVEVASAGRAGANVAIRYAFDPRADQVLADRIQVQQVVLNLVRNAFEAMADSPRRELSIGSRPEDQVVVAYVADTGPGIAPEDAERLFEPFISGKADGMGVGLSISRNIVEAHGGRIWAASNDNGGATFNFTLRRAGTEPSGA